MDVQIGEITSTVRAMDSQTLLHPTVVEQLVRLMLRRVREAEAHDRRVQEERKLNPGVSEPDTQTRD